MKTGRLLLACLAAGLALGANAGLLHRYTFEGNVNDVAGSQSGNPTVAGTYTEAPQFVTDIPAGAVAGAPSRSMELGMNYGTLKSGFGLGNAVINSITNAGSMSVWLKPDAVVPGSYQFNCPGGLFLLNETTGTISAYHFPGGVQTRVGYANGFADGNWHHLAVTWDAAAGKTLLYLNGVPASNQEYDGAPGVGTIYDIRVGSYDLWSENDINDANQFDGKMYDLQFYDHALSAGEVAQLQANPGGMITPIIESFGVNGSGHFEVNVSRMAVGDEYFLLKATDLVAGSFADVVDSVIAVSSTGTLTDASTLTNQAFYKVAK